jgi:beclin 1
MSTAGQNDAHVLSNRMEAADRIFEILSARSDIDHPVCIECTDLLVEGLQKRLNSTNKERDAYVEFLRQANSDIPSTEEVKNADEKLRQARKKENAAMEELQRLETEKSAMERDILELDAELNELDLKEEEFWAERNAHAVELSAFQNERDRVNTQFHHDNDLLLKLQKANVFNDVFSIGYDNSFGTINGLRLGRLPDRAVEWAEINAAWGQTCLLLDTVAERLDFTFHGYKLKPMGSTSKIIETLPRKAGSSSHRSGHGSESTSSDKERIHELYSSGEYAITIGIFNRKFDNAMVVFLECLRQLIQHARNTEVRGSDGTPIRFPEFNYPIEKDKIAESSIKLGGFSQEEVWTRACKTVLICCKYLLAHASNVSELGQRR